MKTMLSHFFLLFSFIIFLIFPIHTLNGAAAGLLLWYNIVLPTLFPFIVITTLIIKTNAFSVISKWIGNPLSKLFHVHEEATLAIIVGFLCGYPMGAKAINDLYFDNLINVNEAKYLLSFCNNSSPMFIISFFLCQTLERSDLIFPVFIALYGAPLIMSFIMRKCYELNMDYNPSTLDKRNSRSLNFSFPLLDNAIIDSITMILKIGGYIILFSIFMNLGIKLLDDLPFFNYILPLFEITTGVTLYNELPVSTVKYLCMIFLISMGGFCAIGQTCCVIQIPEINMLHYFTQKIITAILAVIIIFIIISFNQNILLAL